MNINSNGFELIVNSIVNKIQINYKNCPKDKSEKENIKCLTQIFISGFGFSSSLQKLL